MRTFAIIIIFVLFVSVVVSAQALLGWCIRDVETFLFASERIPKTVQLGCVYWLLRRQLDRLRKRHSSIILHRLADQLSVVWGPSDATPLNRLSAQLLSLQEDNLHSSRSKFCISMRYIKDIATHVGHSYSCTTD